MYGAYRGYHFVRSGTDPGGSVFGLLKAYEGNDRERSDSIRYVCKSCFLAGGDAWGRCDSDRRPCFCGHVACEGGPESGEDGRSGSICGCRAYRGGYKSSRTDRRGCVPKCGHGAACNIGKSAGQCGSVCWYSDGGDKDQ